MILDVDTPVAVRLSSTVTRDVTFAAGANPGRIGYLVRGRDRLRQRSHVTRVTRPDPAELAMFTDSRRTFGGRAVACYLGVCSESGSRKGGNFVIKGVN